MLSRRSISSWTPATNVPHSLHNWKLCFLLVKQKDNSISNGSTLLPTTPWCLPLQSQVLRWCALHSGSPDWWSSPPCSWYQPPVPPWTCSSARHSKCQLSHLQEDTIHRVVLSPCCTSPQPLPFWIISLSLYFFTLLLLLLNSFPFLSYCIYAIYLPMDSTHLSFYHSTPLPLSCLFSYQVQHQPTSINIWKTITVNHEPSAGKISFVATPRQQQKYFEQ